MASTQADPRSKDFPLMVECSIGFKIKSMIALRVVALDSRRSDIDFQEATPMFTIITVIMTRPLGHFESRLLFRYTDGRSLKMDFETKPLESPRARISSLNGTVIHSMNPSPIS